MEQEEKEVAHAGMREGELFTREDNNSNISYFYGSWCNYTHSFKTKEGGIFI
jgi:hypothetical protein